MNNKFLIILINLITASASLMFAQNENPMIYQRWNIMDINRVRTQFTNLGMAGNGDSYVGPPKRPSFEYPTGSGVDYGRAVGVVITAPAPQDPGAASGDNPTNLPYCDATFDEGPVPFWDPYHFVPFPEFVGSDKAPISTDNSTWPVNGWPALIPSTNLPLKIGGEGWPGFSVNGERIADQESFTINYSWQGRKLTGTQEARRWLNTTLEIRGLAWTGQLYQDFIIWVYIVRNSGTAPIHDMRAALHSDFSIIPEIFDPGGGSAPNRHYYDAKLRLAWVIADNPAAVPSPLGAGVLQDPAVMGSAILKMPGDNKVDKYSVYHVFEGATQPGGNGAKSSLYYKYNVLNEDNPRSSKNDGFCDDFDLDDVPDSLNGGPGYFYVPGGQGAQTLSSGTFTLQPGESDTLIFATVFAKSKEELFQNTRNAITLYKTGWKVEKAPEPPCVEIIPGNKQNTIYWNTLSESSNSFEGYKIYRSSDNGVTWGVRTITDFDGGIHYIPLAQFDKVNGIIGNYTSIAKYAWYDLGDDTGLPPIHFVNEADNCKYFKFGDSVRVFVDNDVINGLKYKYYISAYDSGHGIIGPLENTAASVPAVGSNTVEIVPQAGLAFTAEDLNKIKVVPNPYIVASGFETGNTKILQFTNLPQNATIKIYNAAGEIVKTLDHNGSGSLSQSIANWDLKNENQLLVAPGLYFYFVSTQLGTAEGKFVIIL